MQVFELHFNPKKKKDSVFDSFVYEPESPEERQLGSLCVAGELTRVMPQNNDFLDKISDVIKNEFYSKTDISEALREANNFLDKEAKSGNVNWLGNLNLAVINIKDSILNFTKVGNVKILLLREGEVLDISQNLELQDQEPYPLKVFSNIASGKISNQDKIIIFTKEIFSAISKNDALLSQLGQAAKEKEIKNIFKIHKKIISEMPGMCLLITEGNMPSAAHIPNLQFIPRILPKTKKIISTAILIIVLIIAFILFRNGEEGKPPNPVQEKIEEARSKIIMADNFIIMKKEEKARALFQEAWDILEPIDTKEAASLRESIKGYLK